MIEFVDADVVWGVDNGVQYRNLLGDIEIQITKDIYFAMDNFELIWLYLYYTWHHLYIIYFNFLRINYNRRSGVIKRIEVTIDYL